MIRKLKALLAAALLLPLCAVTVAVAAEIESTSDMYGNTWSYTLDGNEATIVSCSLDATSLAAHDYEVTVPASCGGKSVVMLGESLFAGRSSLRGVILPNSIEEVGVLTFACCSSLVYVGKDLKSHEQCAFPPSLTKFGRGAFFDCPCLSLSDADRKMLEDCNAFRATESGWDDVQDEKVTGGVWSGAADIFDTTPLIVYGSGNARIGKYAFAHYPFTNATLKGVSEIGFQSFLGCNNLNAIDFGEDLVTIGQQAFCGCKKLASVTLPDSVTNIGWGAFQQAALENVVFPDGPVTIGGYAFSETAFTSIVIPSNCVAIGEYAFGDCDSLTSAVISAGVETLGECMFNGSWNLKTVVIPASVTNGNMALYSCPGVRSLTVPGHLKLNALSTDSISEGMIRNVEEVTIADGSKSIADWMMDGCWSLKSVSIPDSVEAIGALAFNQCTNLPSVTIPASVKSIGSQAFVMCSSLTNIVFEGAPPELANELVFWLGVDLFKIAPTPSNLVAWCHSSQVSAWEKALAQDEWKGLSMKCIEDGTSVVPMSSGVIDEPGEDPTTSYTVTWNANGGTVSPATSTFANGTKVSEILKAAPTPKRTGYTFGGWYWDAALTDPLNDPASQNATVDINVTFYAKWLGDTTEPIPLTLKKRGYTSGAKVSPSGKSYKPGTKVSLTATGATASKSREASFFMGWYSDSACTALVSTENPYKYTIPNQASVTLYAKFVQASALAPVIDCAESVSFTPGVKLSVPVSATSDYVGEIKVSASGLPGGLKYYSSGKIYGTPKACSKAIMVTVTAKNDAGTTTKKIVFTPVNPGFAVTATVPSADGGAPTVVASKGKVRPYLGVNFELALAAVPTNKTTSSYAVTSVKVSGLKNGLSFDSKTGKITGIPTKTGKQTVKATFTNKWGWSTTFQFYIYPKALPTWLVGSYNGVGNYGSSRGTSKLSVGSTGKVSGKIVANGSSYSFSVNSITSCTNAADGAEIFTARAKVNSKYYALFSFAPATFGDNKTLVGTVMAESEKAGKVALEAYRDVWTIEDLVPIYKSTTLKLTDEQLASYGTGLKDGDALKVKVSSKKPGTATVTGTLAGKEVTVSAPVIVTALETDAGVDGTTTTAYGEIVVPYGKKTLVMPVTWTAGAKPSLTTPE